MLLIGGIGYFAYQAFRQAESLAGLTYAILFYAVLSALVNLQTKGK
jgi:hypothetical protein